MKDFFSVFEPFCARLVHVNRSFSFYFATKHGPQKNLKVGMKNLLWAKIFGIFFFLFCTWSAFSTPKYKKSLKQFIPNWPEKN
jgi:hypothetical protein